MRQYDYDVAHDHKVLAAVIEEWAPPKWARGIVADSDGRGNCIAAARFACTVLTKLNLQCEMSATRVTLDWERHRYSRSVGWGDCRSYAASSTGFPAHAVVIGHDWLFDAAPDLLGVAGPVVALRTGPGEWVAKTEGLEYTWAPGMRRQFKEGDEYGAKAPAQRIATRVRNRVGPCNPPRVYSMG